MCLGAGSLPTGMPVRVAGIPAFAVRRILHTNPEKSRAAEAALRSSQWPQAGPEDLSVSEQTDGRRS
jgi:hypothetical protein